MFAQRAPRMLIMGLAVCAPLTGCGLFGQIGSPAAPAPGSPTRTQIEELLASVRVVDGRTKAGGYQRGCRAGQSCVFGTAWSDDHPGPGGHDGCDTRNNVLARDLTELRFKSGTRDCVVTSGLLADPYTGRSFRFSKSEAKAVQIDHVYPLAAAWDLGASHWSPDLRQTFANDITYNLLAVDGSENQAKGDSTPASWLPPNPAYHCYYAGKYLSAAAEYDLPITIGDRDALRAVAETCA